MSLLLKVTVLGMIIFIYNKHTHQILFDNAVGNLIKLILLESVAFVKLLVQS